MLALQRFLRLVEDAHLRFLFEQQEEARERLMAEQEQALKLTLQLDRLQLEEEQQALQVSRRRDQLWTSLSLAASHQWEKEKEAAATRLPAQPHPDLPHVLVRQRPTLTSHGILYRFGWYLHHSMPASSLLALERNSLTKYGMANLGLNLSINMSMSMSMFKSMSTSVSLFLSVYCLCLCSCS
jgi:hypothetical protein